MQAEASAQAATIKVFLKIEPRSTRRAVHTINCLLAALEAVGIPQTRSEHV
jgi:hypothetical protein